MTNDKNCVILAKYMREISSKAVANRTHRAASKRVRSPYFSLGEEWMHAGSLRVFFILFLEVHHD